MKRSAHLQRHAALRSRFLQLFRRPVHRVLLSRNDQLSGTVIIRHGYLARRFLTDPFHKAGIKPKDRRHRSSHRNRLLHVDASFAHAGEKILLLHHACRSQRRVFAQAQSRRHIRLHALFFHRLHQRHLHGEHGDLGVLRDVQPVILLEAQLLQIQSRAPFRRLKYLAAYRKGLIKILSHSHILGSLSRKNKRCLSHSFLPAGARRSPAFLRPQTRMPPIVS